MSQLPPGFVLDGQGPAAPAQPQFPGVIQGRPKAPPQSNPRDIYEDERDFGETQEDQTFSRLDKMRGEYLGLPQVKNYTEIVRQYANAKTAGNNAAGDQSLIISYAKMLDPNSTVREGEFDTTARVDNEVNRIKAELQRQFGWDGAGRLSPQAREWLTQEMHGLTTNANVAYKQVRDDYRARASQFGLDPDAIIGTHAGLPYFERVEALKKDAGGEAAVEGDGLTGRVSYDPNDPNSPPLAETPESIEADRRSEMEGTSDVMRLARQGSTLGLSDEVAGIGTALGRALKGDFGVAENYQLGRDADRLLNDRARENLGWGGTAIEAVSGGGGVIGKVGAVGSMVRQGAGIGSLGGFGYGEGLGGSAVNALAGGALGGAIGYGGQRVTNALTNRATNNAFDPARAQQVAQAGEAEGVTVNRAMIDPRQGNTFSGVETTGAGPRINRAMNEIEGQVEGRVQSLGRGGQPLDEIATGDKVRAAGERFIETSGAKAKVKYDRAERLAGNAKVTPQESLRRVDAMIGKLGGKKDTGLLDASGNPITRVEDGSGLSETANVNSQELAFLKEIRADLSKDLSVGGLRRMRTKLRKKISKGDLVFGEDEANVLAIMDGAADDIRLGLAAQGNDRAARAFDVADKSYRARMEYITGTVQKILGKRQSSLSAEQIARKFQSMSSNDAVGLRKFYATLEPDEAADVAATFAERLGRNGKGEFSPAFFLTHTQKMSPQALRTLFGREGAESIQNLRTLSQELRRLDGLRNSSNTERARDYKGWLVNALVGGGGAGAGVGLLSGSGVTGVAAAAGTAATVGGVSAARNALTARMLLNTKITKWLNQAPRTTSPKAIDAHFSRLQAIAKAEPALAGDIEILRKAIFGAANDNALSSVAAEEAEN